MKSFKIWLCLSDYYMTYSSDIRPSNPFLDDFFHFATSFAISKSAYIITVPFNSETVDSPTAPIQKVLHDY